MDLGPHLFDLLCYFLEGKPSVIGAVAEPPKNGKTGRMEIHCSSLLRFEDGAAGTAVVGWADTSYRNHILFYGAKGTLRLDLAGCKPITLELRNKPGEIHFAPLERGFIPSLYEHFIQCVQYKKKPWVSGEDGLRTVELIEEAYHFMRTER